MPDFHERLARLADTVRALSDGDAAARALMQFAADLDAYLEEQRSARYDRWPDLLQKWNTFMVAVVDDAHQYHKDRAPAMRRDLARKVAGDPRWQGGYADALALLEQKGEHGQ